MVGDVEALVRKGMEFLDERYPAHALGVDLETLDVRDSQTCPIAQAHGGYYSEGVAAQRLTHVKAISLGFNMVFLTSDQYNRTADALNAEWRRQYEDRKSANLKSRNDI